MRQLLVYDGLASGGAKAYSMGANSYTQIGDTIGSNDNSSAVISTWNYQNMCGPNICQVQNTIYVVHNRILKKKESDGSWSTVTALTDFYSTSSDIMVRMLPCVVNGVTYIVCIYPGSSSGGTATYVMSLIYNTHTGTVSTTSQNLTFSTGGAAGTPYAQSFSHPIYYDGTVYMLTMPAGNTAYGKIVSVGVEAGSMSVSANIASIWQTQRVSMCVFNNELWLLATTGTTSCTFTLYKMVGGSWISQYNVASSITTPTYSKGWIPLLFTYGTYMYAMFPNGTTSLTWNIYRCTSTSATNVTSSVLSGFTGQGLNGRWRLVVDQHRNPRIPEFVLIYQPDIAAGSTNKFYQFTDSSTQLRYLGSAGEGGAQACIATPHYGGGELMYRDGEMYIQFWGQPEIATTPGNIKLYFRIFESDVFPPGSQVHVKMFSNEDRGIPTIPCRLASPLPSGSIENSYTITGIECGSGTLYSVEWRAAVDGFSAGDAVTLVASVSGII